MFPLHQPLMVRGDEFPVLGGRDQVARGGRLADLHHMGAGLVLRAKVPSGQWGGRGHGGMDLFRLLDHPDQQGLDAEETSRERERPQGRRDDGRRILVPLAGEPDGLQHDGKPATVQDVVRNHELVGRFEARGQDLGQRRSRAVVDTRPEGPGLDRHIEGELDGFQAELVVRRSPGPHHLFGVVVRVRPPRAGRLHQRHGNDARQADHGDTVNRLLIHDLKQALDGGHGVLRGPWSAVGHGSGKTTTGPKASPPPFGPAGLRGIRSDRYADL
jgi:hypothetical protein